MKAKTKKTLKLHREKLIVGAITLIAIGAGLTLNSFNMKAPVATQYGTWTVTEMAASPLSGEVTTTVCPLPPPCICKKSKKEKPVVNNYYYGHCTP
jgi:hypothetical protein